MRRLVIALAALATFSVLVAFGFQGAAAQAPVVSQPKLEVLRYSFVDSPPIPVGEVVEFLMRDGQLVVSWQQRRGMGYLERHFSLSGVRIGFVESKPDSHSLEWRKPKAGDIGRVTEYHDFVDGTGGFNPDGVIDDMVVRQYRGWTPREMGLLDLASQFQHELEEKGLVITGRGGDCPPKGFLVNGRKAELGPYGDSYFLPKKGGVIAPYWEGGCSQSSALVAGEGTFAQPGDLVFSGGDNRGSIGDFAGEDPSQFCRLLERSRPQWSPRIVPAYLKRSCQIYDSYDRSVLGQMAKLGFYKVGDTGHVGAEYEKGMTVYQRWEEGRVKLELPPHRWVATNQIELGGKAYQSSVEYSEWHDIHSPVLTGATPWLFLFRWEEPFVFVPNKDLGKAGLDFDWAAFRVFRVVRSGWSEATIHEAVWPK